MRFEFATATRIIFGAGTLRQVGPLAADMGQALAVTGQNTARAEPLLKAPAADTVDGLHASAFATDTHAHAPGDITPQGSGSGLDADTVDGLHASELGSHYQNVVVVAKSGGDFTSVQAAIDSIADAGAGNPYLVWVAPGVYSETVTMKPFVHLQGAGQEATVISSTVSSSAWPPTEATLLLASDASLRDLTVGNNGAGDRGVALMATAGMTRTLVADVTTQAQGGSARNYGIFLTGSGTGVTLQQVTALAENGSSNNYGLANDNGAAAVLHSGSFTARGGITAYGIYNYDSGATLKAESVTALAENGSGYNKGLCNETGAVATLHGGSFTGRGGNYAYGIHNYGSDTILETESVTALAENGSSDNHGLCNHNGAEATLRGGSFTGRGGTDARGIYNLGSTLDAESVTTLGENGSAGNFSLANHDGAAATLHGGSFTGRGGTYATGIYNTGISTTLEIESVIALGENGSDTNFGLQNRDGAAATLRGGSFTGRGGTYARGIYNRASDAVLETESITALGENGTSTSYGLHNNLGAAATLRGGSFTGRGGTFARGIYSYGSGATLETESVTALGENASDENYGLTNWAGAVAVLRGGSFTGRAGTTACGIDNADSDTTLETASVTALGENGSSVNRGLYSHNGAEATLRGSSFTGSGGTSAIGVNNADNGSTLKAESVTALGEGGGNNYGLFNGSDNATADVTQGVLEGATNSVFRSTGTVTVTNSRLVGGVVFGTVTCVAVSHDITFYPGSCP